MTVYGAILAAVSRKVSAFLADVRALVAKAELIEEKIVTSAKVDIEAIEQKAKRELGVLKNTLVDDITNL